MRLRNKVLLLASEASCITVVIPTTSLSPAEETVCQLHGPNQTLATISRIIAALSQVANAAYI